MILLVAVSSLAEPTGTPTPIPTSAPTITPKYPTVQLDTMLMTLFIGPPALRHRRALETNQSATNQSAIGVVDFGVDLDELRTLTMAHVMTELRLAADIEDDLLVDVALLVSEVQSEVLEDGSLLETVALSGHVVFSPLQAGISHEYVNEMFKQVFEQKASTKRFVNLLHEEAQSPVLQRTSSVHAGLPPDIESLGQSQDTLSALWIGVIAGCGLCVVGCSLAVVWFIKKRRHEEHLRNVFKTSLAAVHTGSDSAFGSPANSGDGDSSDGSGSGSGGKHLSRSARKRFKKNNTSYSKHYDDQGDDAELLPDADLNQSGVTSEYSYLTNTNAGLFPIEDLNQSKESNDESTMQNVANDYFSLFGNDDLTFDNCGSPGKKSVSDEREVDAFADDDLNSANEGVVNACPAAAAKAGCEETSESSDTSSPVAKLVAMFSNIWRVDDYDSDDEVLRKRKFAGKSKAGKQPAIGDLYTQSESNNMSMLSDSDIETASRTSSVYLHHRDENKKLNSTGLEANDQPLDYVDSDDDSSIFVGPDIVVNGNSSLLTGNDKENSMLNEDDLLHGRIEVICDSTDREDDVVSDTEDPPLQETIIDENDCVTSDTPDVCDGAEDTEELVESVGHTDEERLLNGESSSLSSEHMDDRDAEDPSSSICDKSSETNDNVETGSVTLVDEPDVAETEQGSNTSFVADKDFVSEVVDNDCSQCSAPDSEQFSSPSKQCELKSDNVIENENAVFLFPDKTPEKTTKEQDNLPNTPDTECTDESTSAEQSSFDDCQHQLPMTDGNAVSTPLKI